MIFQYKGKIYPKYIKKGNAIKYIIPIAEQFCNGKGLDIGGEVNANFPGAKMINVKLPDIFNAYNLPGGYFDYIISSHCLEHLENPIRALEIWTFHLKKNGVLFLYLPHPDMEYWLPQNNRRHLHSWQPEEIVKILFDFGYKNILNGERDMFYSFCVVGYK
jgi:SAM-dependent methyltransferase